MTDRRTEILDRLATLLSGIPGVGFERNRQDDVEADEFPMLVMHDGSERTAPVGNARQAMSFLRWRMNPQIAGFLDSGAADSNAVSTVYLQIIKAINNDQELKSLLVEGSLIGCEFDPYYPVENILHAGFVVTLDLTFDRKF